MRLFHCAAGLVLTSALAFGQTSSITTFAGNQSLGPGFSGNGALATAAQLNNPDGVAVDGSGNVYISDFNNAVVRVVTPDGNINPFAGTGTVGHAGDGGLATSAQLSGPLGLAVDSNGNVYIADGPNNSIRKVSTSGIITTVAGGTAGFGGDGAAATSASLNFPTAVAVDASGNLYIADSANHRIREVSGGIITTLAGSAVFGFGGDNGPSTSAQLYLPKGVAVDSHGNVYIADTGNQRIRKITGTTITTIAGNGTAGYSGDKGAAISAQVSSPTSLTVDPSGNIYIADTGNNVIRRIAVSGVISTVAGNGTAGFAGDGGISTSAELNAPSAVAVDLTGGYTYIADSNNNVVRLIATPYATTYIPHFAAGGNYLTAFYVVNKGTQTGTFTLSFNDDTGTPISVPVSGQSTAGTSFTGTVPAGGTGYYEVGNITASPGVGGSVVITSNTFIVVQAIIRHLSSSGVYYEAADATTTGNFEIKTAFDATTFTPTGQQIYTGFAVVNTDQVNQAILTCTATDSNGNAIANAFNPLTLPPQGHAAQYNFPALLGNRGTVDCSSTTRVGVLTLRFIGNDALSTLPIIPIR